MCTVFCFFTYSLLLHYYRLCLALLCLSFGLFNAPTFQITLFLSFPLHHIFFATFLLDLTNSHNKAPSLFPFLNWIHHYHFIARYCYNLRHLRAEMKSETKQRNAKQCKEDNSRRSKARRSKAGQGKALSLDQTLRYGLLTDTNMDSLLFFVLDNPHLKY